MFDKKRLQESIDLYVSGKSTCEVSDITGISISALRDTLKKNKTLRTLKNLGNKDQPQYTSKKWKLNEKDVLEILELYKNRIFKQTELAQFYGVCLRSISDVIRMKTWKHVKSEMRSAINKQGKERLNKENLQKGETLYASGKTIVEVSELIGISTASLNHHLKINKLLRTQKNLGNNEYPKYISKQWKLSEQDVLEIRDLHKHKIKNQTVLAAEYGVCTASISRVVKRKTWLHIK